MVQILNYYSLFYLRILQTTSILQKKNESPIYEGAKMPTAELISRKGSLVGAKGNSQFDGFG